MKSKHWIIAIRQPAADVLAASLDLPVSLAQVLVNRGYHDEESAAQFLNPRLNQLQDPFTLPGMAAAVERLVGAIERRERIVIYSDYDVDGVTSSALLTRVLRMAGAVVSNFLPHRMDEGYGLSEDGVARCLQEHQLQLLIAVDCGTSSVREIAGLRRQGIDVIVLDHHEPPEELPDCVALVNPKLLTASGRDGGHVTPLASVGVVFKLAHALLKHERRLAETIDLRDHLDLVAVGTVADIVPLVAENRILVRAGLERLPDTAKTGLRTLMDVARVPDEVTPYHIGFRIGPRLNAAGRLADAVAALDLLLTDSPSRARQLAELLDKHNAHRQRIEERTVAEALAMAYEFEGDRVLVLAQEGWHVGVIGIVASRVVQEFYRPTVVIGVGQGMGKGSCRSIEGFSMVDALGKCAPLLARFGGHEMAAGLSVDAAKIGKLRRSLNEVAATVLSDEDLQPRLDVDAMLRLDELNARFFSRLAQIEPCGAGHPTPVFAVEKVRVTGRPRVLKDKHLKFSVTDGGTIHEAIWWKAADKELPEGEFDLAFVPEVKEYRGVQAVQLTVRDLRLAR